MRAISKYKLPGGGGGALIFGGAYTRRSLFSEFFGMSRNARNGHDGESGKKNARGLVKIYKRLQEVLLVKWQSWQKWQIWRKNANLAKIVVMVLVLVNIQQKAPLGKWQFWRIWRISKCQKPANNSKLMANLAVKNRQSVDEKLNEASRGAPCKVAKMANLGKISHGPWWIFKSNGNRGALESFTEACISVNTS